MSKLAILGDTLLVPSGSLPSRWPFVTKIRETVLRVLCKGEFHWCLYRRTRLDGKRLPLDKEQTILTDEEETCVPC